MTHAARRLVAFLRRTLMPPAHPGAPVVDRTALAIYLSAAALLSIFAYHGRSGGFRGTVLHDRLSALLGEAGTQFHDLLPYAWWGGASLVLRVLIPCLILWWLGIRLRDAGLGLRRPPGQGSDDTDQLPWWTHALVYLTLYLLMLPFLFWAGTQDAFLAKYPMYAGAREGGAHFWLFQLFYALQFLGVEFFFRGFLLFPLARRIGSHAVFVSMIPYVMVHFGKPMPETLGAIVAGLVLGALALRSGTIWFGVALHCAVAVTMDLVAMAHHAGGWPQAMQLLF
ncbi:MAG: CPBP family intramembrane metalloprotease [Deltaproteobacteria bacterium]|nr:MAG: CPBP family intramembrane metalloprotease [Deltaproteobacteria bacterium]